MSAHGLYIIANEPHPDENPSFMAIISNTPPGNGFSGRMVCGTVLCIRIPSPPPLCCVLSFLRKV